MVNWISGHIVQGHQIASGANPDSPYPGGSIALQAPYFKALGFDISACHPATLNINIHPLKFDFVTPEKVLEQVSWHSDIAPETFWFCQCRVRFNGREFGGWVYYPLPSTKPDHHQNDGVLEVLCPFIAELDYGSDVSVAFSPEAIKVHH